MLVQVRPQQLRLIRQQDHAGISGTMASEWSGFSKDCRILSFRLILAARMHDGSWNQTDEAPILNPDTGQPFHFANFPIRERLQIYRKGLDKIERVDPYVASLVSLHYSSFKGTREVEEFCSEEEARRRRLREQLPKAEEAMLEEELPYLKLFDRLSLDLCLGAPGSLPESLPSWLQPEQIARAPDGTAFKLRWEGDATLIFEPSPFRHRSLHINVPYRDLPAHTYQDSHDLHQAWEAASPEEWHMEIRGLDRF